jgi:hypothetical protein
MANPTSVALPDPRQHAGVLYPLPEKLLVLSATLAGADDFVETILWGDAASGYRSPSHDTLRDVFAVLELPGCSRPASWPESAACVTPMPTPLTTRPDEGRGKTSRHSHDRRKGSNPLHLVSPWAAARQQICPGRRRRGEIHRDHRGGPHRRTNRNPPAHGLPEGRQDDLGPAIPGRTRVPGPAMVGWNRGRATRQDRTRNPPVPVFVRPLCSDLRSRRAGALGVENPRAPGVGPGLPPRPGTRQDRRRAAKHGDHPPYRALNPLSRAKPTVSSKNRGNADYLETVIRTA